MEWVWKKGGKVRKRTKNLVHLVCTKGFFLYKSSQISDKCQKVCCSTSWFTLCYSLDVWQTWPNAIKWCQVQRSFADGICKQCIWSNPSWWQGPPHHNCVFIKKDSELDGMHGLDVAQVLLFLSFTSCHILYPCALVQRFVIVGDAPCSDTGMWIVKPKMEDNSTQVTSIIPVDSILWGAHLIGVYGKQFLPHHQQKREYHTLDCGDNKSTQIFQPPIISWE